MRGVYREDQKLATRLGISVNAFAAAMGVNEKTVRAKIKNGRLAEAVFDDGSLDETHARALWFANSNPARMKGRDLGKKSAIGEAASEARSEFNLKLDRMAVDLEAAQINLEKLKGSSVDREEARRAVRAFARLHRDHMLRFASRHGPAIAAELGVDAASLVARLDAQIREALIEAFANPVPFDAVAVTIEDDAD